MNMTRKSRYKELCDAYEKGVRDCDLYRKECREFVQDLRSALAEYLRCPETKLYMFQPTRGFVFRSHVIQGDAFDTEFAENGTALIGFALNVNDEELEDKFFTFIVLFKKKDKEFFFSILDDEEEFSTENDGIVDFCEHIFKVSLKNLNERLAIFLESPTEESSPIGFKVQRESTGKKH
jgi:hypothetical protein